MWRITLDILHRLVPLLLIVVVEPTAAVSEQPLYRRDPPSHLSGVLPVKTPAFNVRSIIPITDI